MKKLVFTLVSIFCFTQLVFSQTPQGVIDLDLVKEKFNPKKGDETALYFVKIEELKSYRMASEDSLKHLQKEYLDFVNSHSHRIEDTPAARQTLEKEVRQLEDHIHSTYLVFEKQIEEKEENLKQLKKDMISANLVTFCTINQIEYVVDKKMVLYCKSCTNYTDEFITYLNSK